MNSQIDSGLLLGFDGIQEIQTVADELSIEAYLVGGCIRDYILKRFPIKELDIVIVGDGIAFAKQVHAKLKEVSKFVVYKTYGTAMFQYKNLVYEFVGARKESYSRHSRNPIVKTGTLRDDLYRRDFTINALAVSINSKTLGTLHDYFNGIGDLQSKLIRTPLEPAKTFSDDPLRILRAVRFATRLEFDIEPKTIAGIQNNRHRLEIVSRERIVDELHKILLTPKPSIGLKLLDDHGILELLIPEVTHLKGVEEIDGYTHKDNFLHTLQVVDNISRATHKLWLRWAALLHDIGKPATKKFIPPSKWTFWNHELVGSKMVKPIFKRLHMPLNEHLRYVRKMILMSSRPISIVEDSVTDSAIRRLVFDAGDHIDDLITLCQADITTKNKERFQNYYHNFEIVKRKIVEVENRDRLRNFQPPISGDFIMDYFNIKPSKQVGVIKEAIKEAILQGDIENDYSQAFQLMVQEGKKLGLISNEK
ncbi:MAG: HD domain-containing protein [Flavobacteriaceae bacterium]|nr:HD domain-containing protein [Flavobacteriaceae bacterium]MCY4253384.1 HD domain-containing protein [Flavobacteriaceae bacterium]